MDAIKTSKKKSWQSKRNWLIAIFLFGSLLGISKVSAMYNQVQHTMNAVYKPMQNPSKVSAQTHEPFSMLLLGVDERGQDAGRSDTMVVMTVNGQLQTTKMLSIPRDTRVEISEKGIEDKINHAYAFGGTELAVQTVEEFLGIPIHYVVRVNMESFVEFIDIVGGIAVQNPFEFHYEGAYFPAGELTLNGERALQYVRMRFEDPAGDFGRQSRQRQVLEAIFEKGKSLETLLHYEKILHVVKNHIEMNLTLEDAYAIQKNYNESLKNIESLYFQRGNGERRRGSYYYIPDAAELAEIQTMLQQHLQL
ncbi:MAG: LCP family protein [Solibacillus sp.]